MPIDLEGLERLHAEAAGTPYKAKGDWIYAQSVSHKRTFSRRPIAYTIDNRDGRYKPTETAAYIAAACNAVPELVKMYREAEDKANNAWRILLEAQGRIVEVQKRVRELERQRDWLTVFIKDNMDCDMCPYSKGACTPQIPADCAERIKKAAKEAGEC